MFVELRHFLKRYLRIWMRLAEMAFLMQFANRWSSLGWLGGKMVRFVFFFVFLSAIFQHVPSVANYSLGEAALFFLTFNLVDMGTQIFFRGLYMVGRDIREGDMDFYLIQPVHPLFRLASNLVDFLDLLTLIPVVIFTLYILPNILGSLTGLELLKRGVLYAGLCANGVLISFSIHVLIASLTVRTQQMETTIWLYRDISSLGRFPVDVYSNIFRYALTFGIPVAVMVSYPSKALLGMLSFKEVCFAFVISFVLLVVARTSWRSSLRKYCSVSS